MLIIFSLEFMEFNTSRCDELQFASLSNDSFYSIICSLKSFNDNYDSEFDHFASYDECDNLFCADEFHLHNRFVSIPIFFSWQH